jgi:alpha-beta hydrolase superfamily lysophospholipase
MTTIDHGAQPHTIQHQAQHFSNTDGLQLYYQHWWLTIPARATLILVHGLGGHSGLFQNVVDVLVPQGYHLYALDLRGHGRSPGQRGYINAWAELRGDVKALFDLVRRDHPDLPQFILGHSVGGAVVLDYGLHHPEGLTGLIISNPALSAIGVSPLRLILGRLLSRICPTFSLSTGVAMETAARDPAILEGYVNDPLRHALGTARFATEFLTTTAWIQQQAATLKVPLLILQGGADRVSLPAGSQQFFAAVTLADKTWQDYPESYHEIFDDLDYKEVLVDVGEWLAGHLS